MSTKTNLSARKRHAIALLMTGATRADVAAAVGVHPRTVTRWVGRPLFRDALRSAQDDVLAGATRYLVAGARDMLTILYDVAQDRDVPPGVRVRAAIGWLGQVWRARELEDLVERIDAIERRMAEQ